MGCRASKSPTPNGGTDQPAGNGVTPKSDQGDAQQGTTLDQVVADLEADAILDVQIFGQALQDNGAARIAAALPKCKKLTSLHLEAAEISGKGCEELADAATGNCPALTSINLSSNRIDDRGAIALARLLGSHSAITTILLDNNAVGNDGAVAFAEVLMENRAMETLGLMGNSIGRIGGDAITKIVASEQTLCSVCLDGNPCRDLRMSKSARSKVWADSSRGLTEDAFKREEDDTNADEELQYSRLCVRLSQSCKGFKGASKGAARSDRAHVSLLA